MDLSFYIQLLLNGIVIGVIYALVAMGLSLIFGVLLDLFIAACVVLVVASHK